VYGGVKAFTRVFAEGLWLELRDHDVDGLELVLGVARTSAIERAGLNFDARGIVVAESADVAREGLEWLGRGPRARTIQISTHTPICDPMRVTSPPGLALPWGSTGVWS
jgi:short-subunit dehydrogenase